jgi:hypothetical protein
MGFLDIILAIPLGIIIYIFIYQIISVINIDLPYGDKFQRSLIMLFITGILLLVLANTFFKTNKTMKNKVMQYGLNISGIILIFYSTFSNWCNMSDVTKVIIFGLILTGFIGYIYRLNKINKKKKKKDKEESKKIADELYDEYQEEYNPKYILDENNI